MLIPVAKKAASPDTIRTSPSLSNVPPEITGWSPPLVPPVISKIPVDVLCTLASPLTMANRVPRNNPLFVNVCPAVT